MITYNSFDDAVSRINEHPDYRVLRRFRPRKKYSDAGPLPTYIGLYIDTETTGADHLKDGILEFAMVPFNYTLEGEVTDLFKPFTGLNDPGVPVTDQIRRITGISPEDVAGCELVFDSDAKSLIHSADIVIAHNAGFDRPFVESVYPNFRYRKWGCSQVDVPWKEKFGAIAEKLEVLAMTQCGVFYNAHRALIDCQIGIHVLATSRDESGRTALSYLLESVEAESIRIWAVGAPYSIKDVLKSRGYRWNDGNDGRPKAWNKRVPPDEINTENEWLRNIGATPRITTTNALDRYSTREQ